ncbi:MAG: hypothetical protein IJ188_10095 [Clostridia bacterium]|nr:hypothetical protein [Clostridia bacterium]
MSEALRREAASPLSREDQALAAQWEEAALARADSYLSQVRRLDQRIDQKLRFRAQLRDLSLRITGDPFARPGSGAEDSRMAARDRMMDLDQEIDREVDHLVNLKNEIWAVLDRIENPEVALILDDLYLNGCTARAAAERSGYSLRYLYKLRRWGLMEVDRILREEAPMRAYVR